MRAPRSIAAVLLAGLTAVGLAVAGSPAQAATPYHASVGTTGLDGGKIAMGKTITISGKVWGGPVKNQKVGIYIDNITAPGAFTRRLAVASINSENRYTYKWRTDDAGVFQLRVVKGAYQGHQAVKVTSRSFSVYRWVNTQPDGNAGATTTVAGVVQPSSAHVLAHDTSVTQYTGLYACRAIRLKVGVRDGSITNGDLVFYNAEAEGDIARTEVVKNAPMRSYTHVGTTSLDEPRFRADFDVSGSSLDALVLRDVQQDCAKPVVNQWNPEGESLDEGLQLWCVGEQLLPVEDSRCKNKQT
ncbi:MAG: hypothetical protein EON52_01810 [Actinomycetales bacterium]|nr:MAG: hypothetical protein EON52_01810 [Actinomycetales bacterium]